MSSYSAARSTSAAFDAASKSSMRVELRSRRAREGQAHRPAQRLSREATLRAGACGGGEEPGRKGRVAGARGAADARPVRGGADGCRAGGGRRRRRSSPAARSMRASPLRKAAN